MKVSGFCVADVSTVLLHVFILCVFVSADIVIRIQCSLFAVASGST